MHARQVGRETLADVALVELLEAGDTEEAHDLLHLLLEELDHPLDAGGAVGGEAVAIEAAQPDPVGAEADRLDDIGAAAERAVDDHLRLALHRRDDLGQHGGRAAAMVELAAAMVGAIDAPHAFLERELGILAAADALQDELHFGELILQPLETVPRERGLMVLSRRRRAPRLYEALGDVALAT